MSATWLLASSIDTSAAWWAKARKSADWQELVRTSSTIPSKCTDSQKRLGLLRTDETFALRAIRELLLDARVPPEIRMTQVEITQYLTSSGPSHLPDGTSAYPHNGWNGQFSNTVIGNSAPPDVSHLPGGMGDNALPLENDNYEHSCSDGTADHPLPQWLLDACAILARGEQDPLQSTSQDHPMGDNYQTSIPGLAEYLPAQDAVSPLPGPVGAAQPSSVAEPDQNPSEDRRRPSESSDITPPELKRARTTSPDTPEWLSIKIEDDLQTRECDMVRNILRRLVVQIEGMVEDLPHRSLFVAPIRNFLCKVGVSNGYSSLPNSLCSLQSHASSTRNWVFPFHWKVQVHIPNGISCGARSNRASRLSTPPLTASWSTK